MQAALKDRVKDETEKRQQAIEDNKQKAKNEERDVKEKIQKSIEKGRSRPLLIDSVFSQKKSNNLAKIKALRQFVDILKDQGLNPKEHLDDE